MNTVMKSGEFVFPVRIIKSYGEREAWGHKAKKAVGE